MKSASKHLRPALACGRCRRQKLKCDPNRPCTLCLHAGAICEPQTEAERSRLNHERLSKSRALKKKAVTRPSSSSAGGRDESLSTRTESERFLDTSPSQEQDLNVSPLSIACSNNSSERRQVGAVNSSMDFAKTVIGEDEDINYIGGDFSTADSRDTPLDILKLMTMSSLRQEIIDLGVEAYFDRFHWFVQLLHERAFVARTSSILSRTAWKQDELCDVMLILMVTIVGLKCVANDSSWHGHPVLQSHSVTANGVVRNLLKEIGVHFYDIMAQSRIESYQIVMLLEIYHVYFGSLNFARHMAGVPARVAHGLGLHRETVKGMDDTTYQVGIRCWNHAVVGELFASMIYGQPSSLDPAFARFRMLSELNETPIPERTARLPIIANSQRTVSTLTFHILKFELYQVIQGSLQKFNELQLQDALSIQDLKSLIQAVDLADAKLKRWRENLPAVFDPIYWEASEPWGVLQADDMHCSPQDRSCRRNLALQGIILQVLHDSAIIFAHRPLLQCRISVSDDDQSNMQLQHAPDSLKISAEAALRISRWPISHFKHQVALSFIFLHLFTAGVILCVPPIHLPYSGLAIESKAGVLRIISASRAMSSSNSIARHTDQVLTKLYRKTIQREMDGALRNPMEEFAPHPSREQASGEFGFHTPQLPQLETPQRHSVDATTSSAGPAFERNVPSIVADGYTMRPEVGTLAESLEEEMGSTAHPVVPYLQFSSLHQDEHLAPFLSEHLEEAFGAFDQMYDLNFTGGTASDIFGSENPFS